MVAIPTAATTSAAATAGSERFALIDIAVMISPTKPRIRIAPAAGPVDWPPFTSAGAPRGAGPVHAAANRRLTLRLTHRLTLAPRSLYWPPAKPLWRNW